MKPWLSASALLVALAVMPLRADDVESLHAFNVNLELKPAWTIQINSLVRTFENVGAFNQARIGPVLLWQAKPRFVALAGYYITDQNTRIIHRDYSVHRFFGGGQYRLVRHEDWSIDSRLVVERFLFANLKDYTRTRTRAALNRKTPIGMLNISGEALLQQGVWYGRYLGGMQWRLHPRILFGAGYEFRQAVAGQPSHVIATYFQWTAHKHIPPHVD